MTTPKTSTDSDPDYIPTCAADKFMCPGMYYLLV